MRFFLAPFIFILIAFGGVAFAIPLNNPNNMHNLSSTSSNATKATTETRICVFCHTPHGSSSSSQSALWNRPDPANAGSFPLYSSGTLNIDDPGALVTASKYTDADQSTYPNGSTRMCLSCHDRVSAIGDVLNGPAIAMTDDLVSTPIELDRSHPVSFVYDATVVGLINTAEAGTNYQEATSVVLLDGQSRMQCTTCHDPHTDTWVTSSYELPFWRNYTGVEAADYDDTCQACHLGSDWGGSWGTSPGPTHNI